MIGRWWYQSRELGSNPGQERLFPFINGTISSVAVNETCKGSKPIINYFTEIKQLSKYYGTSTVFRNTPNVFQQFPLHKAFESIRYAENSDHYFWQSQLFTRTQVFDYSGQYILDLKIKYGENADPNTVLHVNMCHWQRQATSTR